MLKCPTVKWSGIQNVLEEAQSDVLILLDCCAGGAINTLEGNGVTELVAACGYDAIANGVGQYSFTSALITELLDLSNRPSFTIAYLYNNIFSRIQGRMPEDGRERHPPPIHLVLTQDNNFPRSIQLGKCSNRGSLGEMHESLIAQGKRPEDRGAAASKPSSTFDSSSRDEDSLRIEPLASAMPKVPRLAFAIRLKDTLRPNQLRTDLFLEWLRTIPAIAEEVKVEAGFGSFSSLIILSIPMALAAFLPWNGAVISLGPITSSNQVTQQKSLSKNPRIIHSGRYTNRHGGAQAVIIPNQNSKRSRDGRPGPVYHMEERRPQERQLDPRERRPIPSLKPVTVLGKLPEMETPRVSSDIKVTSSTSPPSSLVSTQRSNLLSTHTKTGYRPIGQFPPSPPSSYEGSPALSHDELSEGSDDVDKLSRAPPESSKSRNLFGSSLPSYLQRLSLRSGTESRGN